VKGDRGTFRAFRLVKIPISSLRIEAKGAGWEDPSSWAKLSRGSVQQIARLRASVKDRRTQCPHTPVM
jgi:hypothetical protein